VGHARARYIDEGDLPADTNWVNKIRPLALGRSNWLFAASLRAGQRAAAIMSLIQSAKLNGHEPPMQAGRNQDDFAGRLPPCARQVGRGHDASRL